MQILYIYANMQVCNSIRLVAVSLHCLQTCTHVYWNKLGNRSQHSALSADAFCHYRTLSSTPTKRCSLDCQFSSLSTLVYQQHSHLFHSQNSPSESSPVPVPQLATQFLGIYDFSPTLLFYSDNLISLFQVDF